MKKRYVWKSEWCWPYESAWSMIEKFKYANAVTNNMFKSLIELRSSTSSWIPSEELYIFRRSNFSIEKFYNLFGINRKHFSFLDVFYGNDLSQLLHNDIYYCPKCMKFGYHSYFHQLKFINTCPFHNQPLIHAKFNESYVPYSIDTIEVEAYSRMQDRETKSADKYVNVLPARELIDGIWDTYPKDININKPIYTAIRFFNPSTELSEHFLSMKDFTFETVKKLFFNESNNIEPIMRISEDDCKLRYTELLAKVKKWEKSVYYNLLNDELEQWYIASIIDELKNDVDDIIFEHTLSNMSLKKFYYDVDINQFIKAATLIWTSYIVTNSRTLNEALDQSIIYHFYKHKNLNCKFTFNNMLNSKDFRNGFSVYINYIIYKNLFNNLYNCLSDRLKKCPSSAFNYFEAVDIEIPDYIITCKDGYYDIYEVCQEKINE